MGGPRTLGRSYSKTLRNAPNPLGFGALVFALGAVMPITRRGFALGVLSVFAAPALASTAGFDAWQRAFQARALKQGVSAATLRRAFQDLRLLPEVIAQDRKQIEGRRSTEEFMAIATSPERMALGRKAYARYARRLDAIELRFGVEPHVVAAIWGFESFFGTKRGDIPTISALATLAYEGRRGPFFEKQLIAALKILQRGDVLVQNMLGSWAGAMGHTQFIPTTFQAYAVDFTGDGRRDIWGEDPTDALASTAAYLAQSGWTRGQPWGQEVILPKGFSPRDKGPRKDWAALGLRAASGGKLRNFGAARLSLPGGAMGPAFLLYHNFGVIKRYNNSDKYAMAVGYLADQLAGKPALRGSFGPDAQGMTLADRQLLQRRLTQAGFDTQGSDGVIGKNTIAAISAYQQAQGLAVTGAPSLALLARLR